MGGWIRKYTTPLFSARDASRGREREKRDTRREETRHHAFHKAKKRFSRATRRFTISEGQKVRSHARSSRTTGHEYCSHHNSAACHASYVTGAKKFHAKDTDGHHCS